MLCPLILTVILLYEIELNVTDYKYLTVYIDSNPAIKL